MDNMAILSLYQLLLLVLAPAFTGGGVEPASPIALTTSQTAALQARRSCASSQDTFTQCILHRAGRKTRGPDSGSRSALIVVALVFSWSPVRLRHMRGGVGRRRSLIILTFGTSCSMTKPAKPSLHEQCWYHWSISLSIEDISEDSWHQLYMRTTCSLYHFHAI